MIDTQPSAAGASKPKIKYQHVVPATGEDNWNPVKGPSNLKDYILDEVEEVEDLLVVVNNWMEWLEAWADKAEDRIVDLEKRVEALEKDPSKDPPGGKHPPPPPPFG